MTRMSSSPEFDPRIADWLEADPDHAPPAVLDTVLAAVPSIPQRRAARAPWRLPTMNRIALFGAAIATLVAVGLGGIWLTSRLSKPDVGVPPSQPATAPSATPSPGPSTATGFQLSPEFTSTRNGYTFLYPQGWDVTPATTSWAPGTETRWGNPALDVVQKGHDARFVAASQLLEPGQTPEQWYIAYCDPSGQDPACRDYASSWGRITIGSEHGYVDIDGEPALSPSLKPGAPMYDAVIVHNGRGYEFTLDGDADRSLFERMLASVSFWAASTDAIGDMTKTFTSPLYGYTVSVDPRWVIAKASVPIDDQTSTDATATDRIQVAGTDTTIEVAAHELGTTSFLTFLANAQADANADPKVPPDCRPGDPKSWPSIPVGSSSMGRVMVLCNFEQVLVHVGTRVYTFNWSHATFDDSSHLKLTDFEQVLTTVNFPAAPSPLP